MTAWDEVAQLKLSRVLGKHAGEQMRAKILGAMGVAMLRSADDLYAFGELLSKEQGFAAPVGGLLIVHATIHGGQGTVRSAC